MKRDYKVVRERVLVPLSYFLSGRLRMQPKRSRNERVELYVGEDGPFRFAIAKTSRSGLWHARVTIKSIGVDNKLTARGIKSKNEALRAPIRWLQKKVDVSKPPWDGLEWTGQMARYKRPW